MVPSGADGCGLAGLTRLRLYRARRMLGLLFSRDGALENRWREKGEG